MKLKFKMAAAVFLTGSVLVSSPAFASKKSDAKKEIENLNQKIKESGDKGDLQTAITAAEDALDAATKGFGENSLEAAKATMNVANLYMYADHAADAERLYKNAILIQMNKKVDPNGPEMADSYYNLAMAYAVQKKYDEGRDLLNKCYKIRAQRLGENHPDTQKARKALDDVWNEAAAS